MSLIYENAKLKKLKPIDIRSYFVEGYQLPPIVYERLYEIGKQVLEDSDPMTLLAEEAKSLAKDARKALFPDRKPEDLTRSTPDEGSLFDEDKPEEVPAEYVAPEALTKTNIHEAPVIPKKPSKPKKTLEESGVELGNVEVEQIVEAVLLCSKSPMTAKKIALGIKDITEKEVEESIASLNKFYAETKRSFMIKEIAGGYQIRTSNVFEPWLKEIFVKQKVETLTPAGIETLAILAYKQPITKVEVDNIRGVDSGGHIRNLMEKDLVQIVGKSDELGNPNLYGTSKKFLELYGLKDIEELPSIDDIKEMM